jgi:hypothetical protein
LFLATALPVSVSIAVATRAHASEGSGTLCNLNQNTWLRAGGPGGSVIRTLSAGRGFRIHFYYHLGTMWINGHGAEDPNQDGYIPAENVYNCH